MKRVKREDLRLTKYRGSADLDMLSGRKEGHRGYKGRIIVDEREIQRKEDIQQYYRKNSRKTRLAMTFVSEYRRM